MIVQFDTEAPKHEAEYIHVYDSHGTLYTLSESKSGGLTISAGSPPDDVLYAGSSVATNMLVVRSIHS